MAGAVVLCDGENGLLAGDTHYTRGSAAQVKFVCHGTLMFQSICLFTDAKKQRQDFFFFVARQSCKNIITREYSEVFESVLAFFFH